MATENRGLLLLTNVFPYDKGEEFLENEIGALADAFEKVVVIACQTPEDARQTRELPPNVVALRAGGPRPTGRQGVVTAARGLAALVPQRLRGLSVRDPRHAVMDAQFEGRAQRVLRELRPQLAALHLEELDAVTVCAYWLHVPARAAVLLAAEVHARWPELAITQVVSRTHRYDLYEQAAPLGHIPMRPQLLAALDAVHPVSDDGTAYLRDAHPRYASKVSTRRLGTPDPGQRVQASREPFHVVSCSFVMPVKRVDRFAGVLRLLLDEGVDVRWTHYGSGEALDEVRAAAQELLGAERVDMPGYVRNTELADRYRELHPSVFVNLSASEGVPVSIMEVAALGLPVVATDVGGVREIVHHHENGALVPQEFTDRQVADELLRLARMSQQDYAAQCEASRAIWEQEFDMSRIYPAWAAELRG